jgi:ubiquinone biosynthesis protein UbiJ
LDIGLIRELDAIKARLLHVEQSSGDHADERVKALEEQLDKLTQRLEQLEKKRGR